MRYDRELYDKVRQLWDSLTTKGLFQAPYWEVYTVISLDRLIRALANTVFTAMFLVSPFFR